MPTIPPVLLAGRIVSGRLVASWDALRRALLAWPDGEVVVSVRAARNTRSLQANAYYWGVVLHAISESTGYTPEECHELMKQIHLPKAVTVADGNGVILEDRVIGGSTAALSVGDFAAYVTRVQQWAALNLGLVIPDAEVS